MRLKTSMNCNHQNSVPNGGGGGYINEETLVAFEFPSKESNGARRSHEEDIYEDLCYVTLRSGVATSLFTTPPLEKRDYCIRELVETENNYIEALNMIVRYFLRPLKTVLRTEERSTIFMHVKELQEIHTGFHSELFKACSSTQCKLSDCFLHWKDKFVIYGDYCANLPRAQALVEELCTKNDLVNQAVARCQFEASGGKFKLRDLLSLPMQRILKYHLLLNELLKHTGESHEDYNTLQKAYECMIDLGQYINEVKRDSETLQIIADIQASITDLDMPENIELKDYGRLLKDGELKIRSHNNKLKSRYIFIFDKVMLMCKSIKGEQYSYKEAVILSDYDVEDVPPVSTTKYLKDSWSYYWYLVHRTEKTSFMFCAKTEDIKRKWIEAISKAFDNVSPMAAQNTDHSFIMHTFEKPTTCGECEKLLRGIFYQGYKCTVCSVSVHKNCISTVRSCGAPSLPPRPPMPPSSPSVTSISSVDEDTIRAASELFFRRSYSSNGFEGNKYRALISCEGNRALNQVAFIIGDPLLVTQKNALINDEGTWHEGKVLRTAEEGFFRSDFVEPLDIRLVSYEDARGSQNGSPTLTELCVNQNLENYQWYAGTMNREMAQAILERLPSGTFLVRISPKQRGNYAISLKYNGQVKHMRVCMTEDKHFYLSQKKFFKNIIELVKWYEEDTLAESFNGLNITLSTPYKKALPIVEPIAYAIAIYGFTGNSANLLSLRKGDKVAVLSKAGQEKGWWKGQIDSRIGYFPCAYVAEIQD